MVELDMRVDPAKMRNLREERSWSQERLADAAGLSLRTVQRVEREGNASAETRLALAGAFGVDVGTLSEASAPMPVGVSRPQDRSDDDSRLRRGKFYSHLAIYLGMCVFFLAVDLFHNHALTWAQWPIMGWGIGILVQASRTFLSPRT
jgi:transcriptional regulator with XRE-family HTH domain